MINPGMFSNKCSEWETPQTIFDKLDNEFYFTIDVCATPKNAKCKKFYTRSDNGLAQKWSGVAWCNPPYGKQIIEWVKKAYFSGLGGTTTVMLIPARTDARWFHDYILGNDNAEIRFLRGRIKFVGAKYNAPFPSMVVIFRPPPFF